VVGCYEQGNRPLNLIKVREFLEQLNDYQLLKKDSAIWGCFSHIVQNPPCSMVPGITLVIC
jgi:hypothetical protein